MYSFYIGRQTLSPSCCVQESRWKKIIWLENQSLNSLRMLKSSEKKNLFHNTNYLWSCARFKLTQRGNISLVQSKSYGDCVSLQFQYQNFIKERRLDVTQVAQMYNLTDCLFSSLGRVCGKTRRG